MERKHLEYFLAIASHGSFTGAARALAVAQPSLSYAISTLEGEIGAPIFRRLGRGVVLTSVGEALMEPARQVLRDFTRVQAAAERVTGLVSGRLDIVAVTTLAVDPLAEFVGAFRSRYPGIELSVTDPENAAAVIDVVRRGQCELGLTEHDISTAGLRTLRLPEQEMMAVLPPAASAPDSETLSVRRLADLDLVTTPRGTTTRSVLDDVLALVGAPPRIAVETTHRAAIVPLVLTGAGASLLPRNLALDAKALGAVVARIDPPLTRRGVLVWLPGGLSSAAEAFVDLVTHWPRDKPASS
ncbi:DNA-binding transcriptional LysR family regulator [Lipingzhangella halophila]|uniref:DNA-binding transcriptional LysR family regulator n=1 Tax=Lipingzhangella halophila TaxID=1783352 RepID=A0A7W7W4E8_9ACTN|nr:LysR substrate-binding domain-containing protein [Lipingzhangella halophila]MBB4932774.1 DNA-binding transcriptional LysR family regulator [Lipingzhangella halophila]